MTSIVPAAGKGVDDPVTGLGHNRNYQRVWFAGAVSGFGDVVFVTAAVVWVGTIIARQQTWAPLAVSGVMLADMIPAVLLGPIGGVYADRWDRRRTMLATDLARALIVGLLLLLPSFGERLTIALKLAIVYAAVLPARPGPAREPPQGPSLPPRGPLRATPARPARPATGRRPAAGGLQPAGSPTVPAGAGTTVHRAPKRRDPPARATPPATFIPVTGSAAPCGS